jgi:hypothetical protein
MKPISRMRGGLITMVPVEIERSPAIYVALTHTEGFGRFVVYVGQAGESSADVYRRAWDLLVTESDTRSVSEWERLAQHNMSVLSISNARRIFRQAIRTYEAANGVIGAGSTGE